MRSFRVWKEITGSSNDELEARNNCYFNVAKEISEDLMAAWAESSGTSIVAVNSSSIVKALVEALKNGNYFLEEMWNWQVEMVANGSFHLVSKSKSVAVDDSWQEVFEDQTIQ